MGRGDRKTRKGKIRRHSFGKTRLRAAKRKKAQSK
jgi:ribosomal small subunit protein bTHX